MKKSIIIIAVILMASFTTKVMAQMTANNDAKRNKQREGTVFHDQLNITCLPMFQHIFPDAAEPVSKKPDSDISGKAALY